MSAGVTNGVELKIDKLVIKTIKENSTSNQVLVRNPSTGLTEYVDKSTLGGGGAGSSGVSGGSVNYLPKYNSTGDGLEDSPIISLNNNIGIGTNNPDNKLVIDSGTSGESGITIVELSKISIGSKIVGTFSGFIRDIKIDSNENLYIISGSSLNMFKNDGTIVTLFDNENGIIMDLNSRDELIIHNGTNYPYFTQKFDTSQVRSEIQQYQAAAIIAIHNDNIFGLNGTWGFKIDDGVISDDWVNSRQWSSSTSNGYPTHIVILDNEDIITVFQGQGSPVMRINTNDGTFTNIISDPYMSVYDIIKDSYNNVYVAVGWKSPTIYQVIKIDTNGITSIHGTYTDVPFSICITKDGTLYVSLGYSIVSTYEGVNTTINSTNYPIAVRYIINKNDNLYYTTYSVTNINVGTINKIKIGNQFLGYDIYGKVIPTTNTINKIINSVINEKSLSVVGSSINYYTLTSPYHKLKNGTIYDLNGNIGIGNINPTNKVEITGGLEKSGLSFTNLKNKTSGYTISELEIFGSVTCNFVTLDIFGNTYYLSSSRNTELYIFKKDINGLFKKIFEISDESYTISFSDNMAVTSTGIIYISYSNNSIIYKIIPGIDEFTYTLSTFASIPGANIAGIILDKLDNIYSVDYSLNRVSKITPSGTITTHFNTAPGPYKLKIKSDYFYLGTSTGGIYKITLDGLSSVLVGNSITNLVNMEIDSFGNIYTSHYNPNQLRKTTPAGVNTILYTHNNYNYALAVKDDLIYTCHYFGSEGIKIFNNIGTVLETIPFVNKMYNMVVSNDSIDAACSFDGIYKIKNNNTLSVTNLGLNGELNITNDIVNYGKGIEIPNITIDIINSNANGKALLTKEYLLSKLSYGIPLSATSSGTVGDIKVGSDGYIYWCVSTNSWLRTQGLTF